MPSLLGSMSQMTWFVHWRQFRPNSDPNAFTEQYTVAGHCFTTADSNGCHTPNVEYVIEFYLPLDNNFYPKIVAEPQEDKIFVYVDGGMKILNFANETSMYASSEKIYTMSASLLSLNF